MTQQRSLNTQQQLLNSTIHCIAEFGYHQASTNTIVEHAGVSRGAMLHHFPTKVDLLSAAFKQLHETITADVQTLITQAEINEQTWPDLLDEIAKRYFDGPLWDFFLELTVAARTDDALRAELIPTVRQYYSELNPMWHRYFTSAEIDAEVATLLNLSLSVIRGLALQRLIIDEADSETFFSDIIDQLKKLITPLIQSRAPII